MKSSESLLRLPKPAQSAKKQQRESIELRSPALLNLSEGDILGNMNDEVPENPNGSRFQVHIESHPQDFKGADVPVKNASA